MTEPAGILGEAEQATETEPVIDPSVPPRTREEAYERIRSSSRAEFILDEMIRLGFWPKQGELPQDPADEVRRRAELARELEQLRSESRKLYNEAALLKELRKRRLAESRQRRQETKERRERERQERAAAWRQKQEQAIVYLGEGVSGGLNHTESNEAGLGKRHLPVLADAAQIAAAMGISVGRLRFLAFSRRVGHVTHYVRFKLPKKTGGERLISAPLPRLKAAQAWILERVLQPLGAHEAAHGFVAGRSIVSNATPHVGRDVVVNLDLQDFFPTITYRRVKGLFRKLGYSEAAATVLGLVCTEPEVETVVLDGRTFHVALTERRLPQGAPTSPAITNLLCRRLDKRLAGLSRKLGFAYTRYADDLTFSASGEAAGQVGRLLKHVASIVAAEGFAIHPRKTRVLHRGRQQEVTGVVVNRKPNVDRETLRRFRATLYQIEKDGPAGKRWGRGKDVIGAASGFASFVHMVNPEKGQALQAQVRAITQQHGWQPPKVKRKAKPAPEAPQAQPAPPQPAAEAKPARQWWKLF